MAVVMNSFIQRIDTLLRFTQDDIWQIRLASLSGFRSFLVKFLRITILTLRGFTKDQCPIRASALTFYSLLSIVPVLAMAFGIAKGFGFERMLEKELLERFSGQEAVLLRIVDFANTLLETTKGGVMAGIGIALLLWSVLMVLNHIEGALNAIWETRPRTLVRKFSDYLSIMLVSPILVILSGSATVFIRTQVTTITDRINLLDAVSPVIFLALKLLPFGLMWILFTLIYMVMPNTRIRFSSALLAGIIAGSVYQIGQGVYIHFQILVARYNAIYGSFAALPLFLIWLQASWLLLLFGAEVSWAHQNVETFELETAFQPMSPEMEKWMALQITHRIVKAFAVGEKPPAAQQLSRHLDLPVRAVRKILVILEQSGVLSNIASENGRDLRYQPALDLDHITIQFVLDKMDNRGMASTPPESQESDIFLESIRTFKAGIEQMAANKRLKDI